MQFNYAVSLRLQQFLQERKITQYELAKRSGIPPSTVNSIIWYKTPPRSDTTILNICRGLEIEMYDFYLTPLLKRENISDD